MFYHLLSMIIMANTYLPKGHKLAGLIVPSRKVSVPYERLVLEEFDKGHVHPRHLGERVTSFCTNSTKITAKSSEICIKLVTLEFSMICLCFSCCRLFEQII